MRREVLGETKLVHAQVPKAEIQWLWLVLIITDDVQSLDYLER